MAELLRALAHPVRLQLVRACWERERPVGELVVMTGLAGASVSEHLKVLRKTGLLGLQARGRWRVYRTDTAVVQAVARELGNLGGLPEGLCQVPT